MHYTAREYAPAGALWVILERNNEEIARFRIDRPEGSVAWHVVKNEIARDCGSVFMQRKDGSGGYVVGSLDQIIQMDL
jgi:hypothetical protein